MEKEKLIWAGFGVFTIASFMCFQFPFSQPTTKSSSTRHGRGDHTNSRQRHSTLSHLYSSEKTNRSRGSVASKKMNGGGSGFCEKSETVSTSQQNTSPAKTQEANGSSSTAVASAAAAAALQPSHRPTKVDLLAVSRKTTTNCVSSGPLQANVASLAARKNRRLVVGRSTQTKSRPVEELCRAEDLVSVPTAGDELACISPISKKEKYIPSPISSAEVYFSPNARGEQEKDVCILPSLERGVEMELMRLMEAVNSQEANPKLWVDLHNFLIEIPWRVLRQIINRKTVVLSFSPFLSASMVAENSAENGLNYFLQLKNEVYRLLNGHSPRKKKNYRFAVSEDGSEVLLLRQKNGRIEEKKKGRFSHICLSSSDDDDDDNDVNIDKEIDEDNITMMQRIEKVLLARRRAGMTSLSTQFPDEHTLKVVERAEKTSQATAPVLFENREVLMLLWNLVKLRDNAAFNMLQSRGVDISLLAGIIDATNEAQRLLDRAALKMRVMTPVDPQQSHSLLEPNVVFAATQTLPQMGRQLALDNPLLTPHAAREERSDNSPPNFLWTPPTFALQDAQNPPRESRSLVSVTASGDIIDIAGEGAGNDENTNNVNERPAATPPANGDVGHLFARLLTTSTIPSTCLKEDGQRRTAFERSRTQVEVGRGSEFVSSADSALGATHPAQSGRSVFDRLYTPPKVTLKASQQPAPPSTARSKARFNLYI